MTKSATRWIGRALPLALLGAAVCGALVRVSVRDRVPVVSAFFYATPIAVIVALCAGTTALLAIQRRRRWAAAGLGAVLASCSWWGGECLRWAPRTTDPGRGIRVLFWNVCHGKLGWDRIASRIPFDSLDVVVLAEAGKRGPERDRFWAGQSPDMTAERFGKHGVVMARGEVEIVRAVQARWRMAEISVVLLQGELTLVVVDMPSSPWRNRRVIFQDLKSFVSQCRSDRSTVLLGDFNTPRESIHFDSIRESFRNAFECAGRGLADTWPTVVPCLCIDHIWVGDGVDVLRCEHRSTTASDHRQVVAELRLRPKHHSRWTATSSTTPWFVVTTDVAVRREHPERIGHRRRLWLRPKAAAGRMQRSCDARPLS